MRKIIILATSDIWTWRDGKSQSTGRLEAVIAEGYEVYVASTRFALGENDIWWKAIVPHDHIFLADPPNGSAPDYSSGWRRCIEHLGITWPTEGEVTKISPDNPYANRPASWTLVRAWLKTQGIDTLMSRQDLLDKHPD